MKNSWTVGQFRFFRILLGVYLLQHFLALLPWGRELFSSAGVLPSPVLSPLSRLFPNVFLLADTPFFVSAALLLGAFASLLFTLGKFDRLSALLIWYLWACLYGRNPLIGNPSLPFIGWMLLAYLLIPSSSSNDGSAAEEWQMPRDIYVAAWILMSVSYLYSGCTKLVSPSWLDGSALTHVLENPLARETSLRTLLLSLPPVLLKIATWFALTLELTFAGFALSPRLRPWIWLAMVTLHLGLLALVNFTDLTVGMLLLHMFTFDPAWVRAPQPAGEPIFFDGECALCHGFVSFVLHEDHSACPFTFSPLRGESIKQKIAEPLRSSLPDSVVVVTEDRRVLTRSAAVLFVLRRLGGFWSLLALVARLVPLKLRDWIYDAVAVLRKRLLGQAPQLCPIVPAVWRTRLHA